MIVILLARIREFSVQAWFKPRAYARSAPPRLEFQKSLLLMGLLSNIFTHFVYFSQN